MYVTTAEQSAQRDAAAMAHGVDGFSLMVQAGTQAAAVIMRVAGARLAFGVDVVVGSGNNGGDGYIVAAQLARLGVNVRVLALVPPATPNATRAAALAGARVPVIAMGRVPSRDKAAPELGAHFPIGRGVIVDALLGTGARGPLRDSMRNACEQIHAAQQHGCVVIALDMPTGVNATTGEIAAGHVTADVTIMFGTMRLGALSARHVCGDIQVVDIGLGPHAAQPDGAAQLATAEDLCSALPLIAWDAHKGVRGRTLIIGGDVGMAGAVQLASSGALASGAGLVRACVAEASVLPVQTHSVAVVCSAWPETALLKHHIRDWAHVVVIGPGLGRDARAATLLHTVLECAEQSPAALVLDADALTVMAQHNMLSELRRCATARAVVITPHKGEFRTIARALELAPDDGSPEQRLSATRAMADALQCTVLAKGTPTICASPAGDAWIVPRGSNALATGGTGDVLSGVIAALLAAACANAHATTHQTSLAATHQTSLATTHQTSHATTHQSPRATTHQTSNATAHATHNRPDAPRAAALAALAAWVHGVAGESLPSRGSTVTDVVHALPTAWSAFSAPTPLPPGVLAHLPTVHAHVTR